MTKSTIALLDSPKSLSVEVCESYGHASIGMVVGFHGTYLKRTITDEPL